MMKKFLAIPKNSDSHTYSEVAFWQPGQNNKRTCESCGNELPIGNFSLFRNVILINATNEQHALTILKLSDGYIMLNNDKKLMRFSDYELIPL